MESVSDFRVLLAEAPVSSPLWALADAFDAVTNGMENPEALARLHASSGDPELECWKALVAAIRALYDDDPSACRRALESLDPASPPGRLIPIFRAWIADASAPGAAHGAAHGAGGVRKLVRDGPLGPFIRTLVTPTHPLSLMAEQAEEALRQGLYGHFENLTFRVLRELQDRLSCDGPLHAVRYARYALATLTRAGFDETGFLTQLRQVMGSADATFVLALRLVVSDRASAAKAFRSAAEEPEGEFVRARIREALPRLADALEGSDRRQADRARDKGGRPRESTAQLELF